MPELTQGEPMHIRASRPVVALATIVLAASLASAHKERPVTSPPRPGSVPELDRKSKHALVVCKASSRPTKAELGDIRQRLKTQTGAARTQAKAEQAAWKLNSKLFKKCRYEHIQAAVNDATDGTDIKVLPGVYREEPSRAQPTTTSGDLPDGSYSYEYHVAHPNDANLIAIMGKKNVTLEGTGADPRDVVIDAGFVKDIPIRGDRADGIIIRNLWARDGNEHCIYVIETDGYVFDRTVGSFCKEYELFSFASDHGLFTDSEAEGGGDSGVYIGGHPDTHLLNRFSAELRTTKMHTNSLGFSGTQGTSVWMHDNDVYDNAVGISFDTENDHPDPPQRWSLIENNLIHDNNLDIYSASTPTPAGGPAYNFLRYPVGTGMWIPGGEDDIIRNNWVYDNQRWGIMIFGNPTEAPVLAETNRDQVTGNIIGVDPDLNPAPNGTVDGPGTTPFAEGTTDVFWGGSGVDNCFAPQDPRSGPVKYGPPTIGGYVCPYPNVGNGGAFPRQDVVFLLLSCVLEEDPMNPGQFVTTDEIYPCPWGHQSFAPYQNKDEKECGNGTVDLGEQCDSGYGGGMSVVETCQSIGHGPGSLDCNAFCDFDASGCAAGTCARYANGSVRVQKLGAPSGDEQVTIELSDMETATAFDPTTEPVDVTIRGAAGVLYQATIAAGDPKWGSKGADTWVYKDPSGTIGGIQVLEVRTGSTGKLSAKIKKASIAGASTEDVIATTVRIGDDCWSGEESCSSGAGATLACKKSNRL
jgi:hypothetical protein